MKKVLVIDGDIHSRNTVKSIIGDIEREALVYEADNVAEAFGIAMTNSINMFIVDIALKEGRGRRDNSGANFILNIREVAKYRHTPVIVVSSVYDEGMFLYANAHIYRYIEKPYNPEIVKSTIKEALEHDIVSWRPGKVIYQIDGLLECIEIDSIIYAQSNDHVMRIVATKKEYLIPHLTCNKLLKDIDNRNFVTCFRGCIVNVGYIQSIDRVNRYIHLEKCEDRLEIGLKYKKSLISAFLDQNN